MTRSSPFWRQTLRVVFVLLVVWALLALGCAIVWVESLNRIRWGGFGLGFWFAHQGAILGFVGIVATYAVWMDRLERRRSRDARGRDEA